MGRNNKASGKRLIRAAFLTAGLVALTCRVLADGPTSKSAPNSKLPPFATVKTTVERTLSTIPGYVPGDLVSQRQVATVLGELNKAGWEVEQSRKLLARVPADGEFLVRALRTPKGVAFMRQVSAMPGGYDRIDRLSRIPNGQQTVQKLIEGPDGHKLVGYLTEARGGKELGTMLKRTAQGGDFNEATGRIYTATQVLAELESLHEAAVKHAGK
jgi:hypothetical protein